MVSKTPPVKGKRIGIRRKVFHLLLGTVFILSLLISDDLRWFYLVVLGIGVVLSIVQERKHLPIITWFLDRYDKSEDEVPGQGPLTFFLGCVVVWFLFPRDITLVSMIVMTFGDPLAFLGGVVFKGPTLPWNPGKTWAGMFTFMLVPGILIHSIIGPWAAIAGVLVGGIVETICLPHRVLTDDNFLVPVSTALLVWILSLFLPIL